MANDLISDIGSCSLGLPVHFYDTVFYLGYDHYCGYVTTIRIEKEIDSQK